MDGSAKTRCAALPSRMAIRFHRRKDDFAKDETVAVIAVENNSIKVQRGDGSENLFPLGAGCACFDVGEKRKLKIAAGEKLLLQANTSGKRFINRRTRRGAGDSGRFRSAGRWPRDSCRLSHLPRRLRPSRPMPPRARPWMKFCWSPRRVRCPPSIRNNFTSASRAGASAAKSFTDDSELLRLHVTHSSARLAAVEAMPQRDFLQTYFAARQIVS